MSTLKITGLNSVIQNLNLKLMEVTGDIEQIAERGGRVIEKRVKENLTGDRGHQRHIITGNLRRSIDTRAHKISTFIVEVAIGTDTHYAVYVEARDKTGGYLYPGFVESKQEALDLIGYIIAGKVK